MGVGCGRRLVLAAYTLTMGVTLGVTAVLPRAALPQAAVGPETRSSDPLTLDAAVDLAFARNPGLVAAGLGIEIERAARDALALPTPYTASGEVENIAGGDSLAGIDSAETTLQLSRVLERGGKRGLRSRLGDARIDLAEAEARLVRVDLAAEVARRFVRVAAAEARIGVAADAVAIAESTLALVRRRVDVGRSSEAELATAEIAVADAALELSMLERRLAAERTRLASLWAADTPDFGTAAASLFTLPPIEPFEALAAQIDANPDLLRLTSEARILAAEQRVAEARRLADPTVSLGLRHLAQPGDAGLVVSVSVPIGSRSRALPSIAEAAARQQRQPHLIAQRRLELATLLFELRQQAAFAREQLGVLRDDAIPRGERAVALYRQGFELGSYSLFELNQAQNQLIALRQRALAAAAGFHQAFIDIEQLLGASAMPEDSR